MSGTTTKKKPTGITFKPPNLGGATGAGGFAVYLPDDLLLQAWLGKGEYEKLLPTLNKEYKKGANGLREVIDPGTVNSSTSGVPDSGSSLLQALYALPGSATSGVQGVMLKRLGLVGSAKDNTLSTKSTHVYNALVGARGHLGNVDPRLIAAQADVTAGAKSIKQLTSLYLNNRANETFAAVEGASVSSEYTAEEDADNYLTQWGIDTPEMTSLVQRLATGSGADITNVDELMNIIRETPTYKTAFEGLAEYNAVPGHVHMTESEYRTYSSSVQGAAQQYGVPNDFISQKEIGTLLKGDVSAPEFQQRVEDVYSASKNADPGTKALLQQYYGIGPKQLLTYWANPKVALPTMQRDIAAAEIADDAQRVGLQGLGKTGATQLADMAKLSATQGNNQLGTGVASIESSLLTASKDTALLKSAPGADQPSINTKQLIGSQIAGFGGTNQESAQIAVGRAEGARAAPFDRGGGYAETSKGVTGVGSAAT